MVFSYDMSVVFPSKIFHRFALNVVIFLDISSADVFETYIFKQTVPMVVAAASTNFNGQFDEKRSSRVTLSQLRRFIKVVAEGTSQNIQKEYFLRFPSTMYCREVGEVEWIMSASILQLKNPQLFACPWHVAHRAKRTGNQSVT